MHSEVIAGSDRASVSRAYADRMPFAFDGDIRRVHIGYQVPQDA